MTIKDMQEARLRLSAEAVSLTKGDMNAETRAKILTIYADADAIKANIDLAERAEALEAELRSSVAPPVSPLSGNAKTASVVAEQRAAYKSVFGKYLRGGVTSLDSAELRTLGQYRDLTGATGSNGAYLIETDLQKDLQIALKSYGGMRQVAKNWKTSQGNPVQLPLLNDTANPGKRLNATSVPGTVDELDLVFGQTTFGTWTYTTQQIKVSNELLRDADLDIESIIKDAFVERIGRIQNTEFTNGTGSTMPVGLAYAAPVGFTAATGGATSINYADFVNTLHSLDPAYRGNAKWMFHDTTLAAARLLVDTLGRALLGLGINGGDPDSILGYKFQINQDVPVIAANAKSILFGDFNRAYTIRDVGDLKISRLDELGMQSNETIFIGFSAADGQFVNAGTPAAVAFKQSAT